MDEAGYDMLDEEDYEFGSKVKKENLISRLRTTMNLTPDEESRLHIVCIAADPKGKGLPYWFSKEGDYLKAKTTQFGLRVQLLEKSLVNLIIM